MFWGALIEFKEIQQTQKPLHIYEYLWNQYSLFFPHVSILEVLAYVVAFANDLFFTISC